jgi:hypothetical protein
MSFSMLRDAHVSVREGRNEKNAPVAIVTINDAYEHHFEANSRVSKALETATVEQVADRLNGGDFFFIGDNLIDFRDRHYNGFVHSNDNIDRLMDVLGVETRERKTSARDNTANRELRLSRTWSNGEIDIPAYKEGGEFTSALKFLWNPFSHHINSELLITRLLCANGMIGTASLLNAKIPLINRWEEHLDIASRQIQNKINTMVSQRLQVMGKERASVAETIAVADHARKRMEKVDSVHVPRLRNIFNVAHPAGHLNGVYNSNVFEDTRVAAQMPAHLSTFDVYNMITEIRSHTPENFESTDFALDKMANGIVFDRKDLVGHVGRFTAPRESAFSDPDAAFFGEIH